MTTGCGAFERRFVQPLLSILLPNTTLTDRTCFLRSYSDSFRMSLVSRLDHPSTSPSPFLYSCMSFLNIMNLMS